MELWGSCFLFVGDLTMQWTEGLPKRIMVCIQFDANSSEFQTCTKFNLKLIRMLDMLDDAGCIWMPLRKHLTLMRVPVAHF